MVVPRPCARACKQQRPGGVYFICQLFKQCIDQYAFYEKLLYIQCLHYFILGALFREKITGRGRVSVDVLLGALYNISGGPEKTSTLFKLK